VKCEAVPGPGPSSEKRRCMRMTSRPELRQQYDIIGSFQPARHEPQNWNYENPAPLFRAFMHPPHDVGGQHDVPVYYEEKEEEQWELNTYVTCEVLGWRGIWTAEERRRRADNDLGYTLYLGMPYYGRWIWSAARMLVDKKHISLTDLLEKIAEVKARYETK
jgi:thiocyanate hydrolase subunit beta